jgi:hypothetical protein
VNGGQGRAEPPAFRLGAHLRRRRVVLGGA